MSANDKRWVYACQAPNCTWLSRAFEDQQREAAEQERPCHPEYRLRERKVARFRCDRCRTTGVIDSGFLPDHRSPDDHGEGDLSAVEPWW